jgi:hypothetical protein
MTFFLVSKNQESDGRSFYLVGHRTRLSGRLHIEEGVHDYRRDERDQKRAGQHPIIHFLRGCLTRFGRVYDFPFFHFFLLAPFKMGTRGCSVCSSGLTAMKSPKIAVATEKISRIAAAKPAAIEGL